MFHSLARYFRVSRHDLVYLKFILEAYEGLAVLSTIEREGAIVRIGIHTFPQRTWMRCCLPFQERFK